MNILTSMPSSGARSIGFCRSITAGCAAMCLLAFAFSSAEAGDPALPGNHPLSQVEAGRLLIAERRCGACHRDVIVDPLTEKKAPDLSDVGSRIAPDYLRQYLAAPLKVHPGTTMPDVLVSKSEEERAQIAEALTHYLVAQSRSSFDSNSVDSTDREQGNLLFHSVGCVACHGAKEQSSDSQNEPDSGNEADDEADEQKSTEATVNPHAVALGHIPTKYSVKSLSEFLFQPLKVRASGRMPDMKLTPSESQAIAGYLLGDQSKPAGGLVVDSALSEKGKRYFQEFNCGACHSLPDTVTAPLIGSLKTADLTRGCLAKDSDRSPRFDLTQSENAAIASAIRADASGSTDVDSDKSIIAKTMTAFRCTACHVRDDYGGVHEAHNSFFTGSEVKLGDDGRIPPPLTLVGAKLQPAWMKKVLFDGESVRFYMSTRMPQYGMSNLAHLPEVLSRLDSLTTNFAEMNILVSEHRTDAEREREKLMRAAGRELLGDKGANCVACHSFNGKAAHLNQGIDLLTSYERLQPQWFSSYLRNPGAFRPRTVMPTAWPNGRAVFTTILDGDTDRQIEAIWYYLSLGTSAADPSGVKAVNTRLTVGNTASIHRGRSRVAGYRGIAVGLPEKISYAFNAETGTLSAIWLGEFVNVNWSGQGSGDFNPAREPITLPQDVSFVQLADENDPWPLLPVMTKEARTNTNPLYPKNVGYQFRGYFLDDSSIPTFRYRCGSIDIEDRSVALGASDQPVLKRTLRLDSRSDQTVWFRVLSGEITQESKSVFRTGKLRVTIPQVEAKLRPLADQSGQSELLLRLPLSKGQLNLELHYEPLKE